MRLPTFNLVPMFWLEDHHLQPPDFPSWSMVNIHLQVSKRRKQIKNLYRRYFRLNFLNDFQTFHLGENPTTHTNASCNKNAHTSINNHFFRIFQNGIETFRWGWRGCDNLFLYFTDIHGPQNGQNFQSYHWGFLRISTFKILLSRT